MFQCNTNFTSFKKSKIKQTKKTLNPKKMTFFDETSKKNENAVGVGSLPVVMK